MKTRASLTTSLEHELAQLRDVLAAREAEINRLRQENKDLAHNVEVFRKLAFGPTSERRSGRPEEKDHPKQGFLFVQQIVEEAERTADQKQVTGSIIVGGATDAKDGKTQEKPKKTRRTRATRFEHLPKVTTRYELPADQRVCACGNPLHVMGTESCLEVERIEFVVQHVIEREKYGCRKCEQVVRVAPGPDRPFEKGLLGVGFLANVVTEHIVNHMPYYRLEQKYSREGVELGRALLERSVAKVAARLMPLHELLRAKVRASGLIFTDDSPVTIAQPGDRESGSKQGRVWIYLDRQGNHCYEFTDSREAKAPREWLKGFKGYIHADAFPGYDEVFVADETFEVACWAHTRRKFLEAEKSDPEYSKEIVDRIRELYDIEKDAKARKLNDDQRKALRQERALPILQRIRARLAELETKVLPKCPLAQAIGYAFRQWTALTRYTTDGRLEIDNNAAERALRGVAVGRKNWLFYMTENGGQTGVTLMSLLRTAMAAGVDPQAWLRDVLVRIDHERDFEKLLPAAWKEHFAGDLDAKRQDLVRRLAN